MPRYRKSGAGLVEARGECPPAQITRQEDYVVRRPASGVVIGDVQRGLSVLCGNIAGVYRSVHFSGPNPSDRISWPTPKIPVNNAKAGVGNRGAGQNREAARRSEVYGA